MDNVFYILGLVISFIYMVNGKFQINSSKLCLTYPQCPIDKNTFLSWAKEQWHPVFICVAEETHKDGSSHIHIALSVEQPIRTRDPRHFDFESYHCNVQSARRFRDWVKYVKKEGNYVEEGTLEVTKWSDITPDELLEKAKTTSLEDFLAYCSCNKMMYAQKIWETVHVDNSITIDENTDIPGTIETKVEQLLEAVELHNNLSILLIGPAGIGKTTWAKRTIPKPCLFVSHMDDLKKFRIGFHVSIIFDDVSILHMPIQAQIHIVDTENPRSIHCRYGCARIPAGIIKMFTCNSVPVNLEHNAISRRTKCYTINELPFQSGAWSLTIK